MEAGDAGSVAYAVNPGGADYGEGELFVLVHFPEQVFDRDFGAGVVRPFVDVYA